MAALVDITNRSTSCTKKKRLSDGTIKEYTYETVRKQLTLSFHSCAQKLAFDEKMNKASTLFSRNSGKSANTELSDFLLDMYLQHQHVPTCNTSAEKKSSANLVLWQRWE